MDENIYELNVISKSKAENFCSDYNVVKEKLDVDRDFSIYIVDLEDPSLLNIQCTSGKKIARIVKATIRRIVSYRNGVERRYAEVIIDMW